MSNDDSPSIPPVAVAARPWGFWATTGFALVIFAAFSVVGLVVGTPFRASIVADNPDIGQAELAKLLQTNGLLVSLATLVGGFLTVALIAFFVRLRKGIALREYLALARPDWRTIGVWLTASACFLVASHGLKFVLGYDLVVDFQRQVYMTSRFPPLLLFAVIVIAPITEECLFRGFLFAGWSQSKLGVVGTIVLTSLLFALVHPQYDFFHVVLVFVFSILVGIARHRTGSLVVPIIVHSIVNLTVAIETVIAVRS